jgi:hypothetical protein
MNGGKYIIPIIIGVLSIDGSQIAIGATEPIQNTREKPAREVTATDLNLFPASNLVDSAKPFIIELAKCQAAAVVGHSKYAIQMGKVSNKLEQAILKVLPVVEPQAKEYDIEIEYNRQWWSYRGYLLGIAATKGVPVETLANEQVKQCLQSYYDGDLSKIDSENNSGEALYPWAHEKSK